MDALKVCTKVCAFVDIAVGTQQSSVCGRACAYFCMCVLMCLFKECVCLAVAGVGVYGCAHICLHLKKCVLEWGF